MRKPSAGLGAELGSEALLEVIFEPTWSGRSRSAGAARRRSGQARAVGVITIAVGLLLFGAVAASSASAGPFSWTAPQQIDHQYPYAFPDPIISMSCPSVTLCVGNDGSGGLLSSSNLTGRSEE